jgi:hypothetical protein
MSAKMTKIRPASERVQVIEAVTRLFIATDMKDWASVRNRFTDGVLFDMSSLDGEVATIRSGEEIAMGWKNGLNGVPALHHQVGNFIVTIGEGEARVFCYGIALHLLSKEGGGKTRTFVGSYDFQLVKTEEEWKITLMAYHSKFIIDSG